jgi:hypothetical protein
MAGKWQRLANEINVPVEESKQQPSVVKGSYWL